jgi:hypothetical protein
MRKKLQVGLTCCLGTHDLKDSTHTVRYYPLKDSVLRKVHEFIGFWLFLGFEPTTSPLRIPHTRGLSQLKYTSIPALFLLEIGYQSGTNKNEIRFVFVFVCKRRVKATKMCKSRSNYPFLFFFFVKGRALAAISIFSLFFVLQNFPTGININYL